MSLPSLNLGALQAASLRSTNRRLSRFLLGTLDGSIARFHTRPEDVPLLVANAGASGQQQGLHLRQGIQLAGAEPFLAGSGLVERPRKRIGCGQSTRFPALPSMSDSTC